MIQVYTRVLPKSALSSRENPKNVPKPLISYFDTRDSGILEYVSCCELVCENACNIIILCLFYARVVLMTAIILSRDLGPAVGWIVTETLHCKTSSMLI